MAIRLTVLLFLLAALGPGCATAPPGEGNEANICRAAQTEVSGYLEARKRGKGPKAVELQAAT